MLTGADNARSAYNQCCIDTTDNILFVNIFHYSPIWCEFFLWSWTVFGIKHGCHHYNNLPVPALTCHFKVPLLHAEEYPNGKSPTILSLPDYHPSSPAPFYLHLSPSLHLPASLLPPSLLPSAKFKKSCKQFYIYIITGRTDLQISSQRSRQTGMNTLANGPLQNFQNMVVFWFVKPSLNIGQQMSSHCSCIDQRLKISIAYFDRGRIEAAFS